MPILSWLTRDEDIRAASRVPYRLLEEAPDLGAGDPDTGNMLIQGDKLKALLPFYAGPVECPHQSLGYMTLNDFVASIRTTAPANATEQTAAQRGAAALRPVAQPLHKRQTQKAELAAASNRTWSEEPARVTPDV